MSELQKDIASAITSSDLTDEDLFESALDRIEALGHSVHNDGLGIALWRLKWANDPRPFHRAYLLISKRLDRRPGDYDRKIARVVLEEWLNDKCHACAGRGHTVIAGTPHSHSTCKDCNGSGAHRATDKERIRHSGLPPHVYRKHERHFSRAHQIIAAADERTREEVGAQLERWGAPKHTADRLLARTRGRAKLMIVRSPAQINNTLPGSATSAPDAEQQQQVGDCAGSVKAGPRVSPVRPFDAHPCAGESP